MDEEPIANEDNKIKKHFKTNKVAYITGGVCLLIGAVSGITFVKSQTVTVDSWKLINWKSLHVSKTTVVQLPARGHRGYAIVNNKTGEVYGSLKKAAEEIGCATTTLRSHLEGALDNIHGETFTNLGENLSSEVSVSA